MRQPESGRGNSITCPACGQEGQRITCMSGSKSEVIVYHPMKILRTICRFAWRKQDETDTVEAG